MRIRYPRVHVPMVQIAIHVSHFPFRMPMYCFYGGDGGSPRKPGRRLREEEVVARWEEEAAELPWPRHRSWHRGSALRMGGGERWRWDPTIIDEGVGAVRCGAHWRRLGGGEVRLDFTPRPHGGVNIRVRHRLEYLLTPVSIFGLRLGVI